MLQHLKARLKFLSQLAIFAASSGPRYHILSIWIKSDIPIGTRIDVTPRMHITLLRPLDTPIAFEFRIFILSLNMLFLLKFRFDLIKVR